MITIKIIFWILIILIFYSYIGYSILLYLIVKTRTIFKKQNTFKNAEYEPEVTLFVAAYNEKDYVDIKIKNSLELDYPIEKIKHIWVTDGSDDGTPDLLKEYKQVDVYHKNKRGGKIGALNRGMQFVKTPIVIFSDGNTVLSKESIREIVNCFKDDKVGCVAGEKRILKKENDSAAGSGEGFYWKYESFIKKYDSELYSVVGAAGELFAIRTELFEKVEDNILLDDFIISLRIAMRGYKIKYAPKAYAKETSSENVKEELKRKIRISAGAIQSVFKLKELLNIFKYKTLTFQYVSHKLLRWIFVPFALPILFILNLIICLKLNAFSYINLYAILFWVQIIFYTLSLLGAILQNYKIKLKIIFVPYYIFIMNLAIYLGFFRYIKGNQSVNWERAKRGN